MFNQSHLERLHNSLSEFSLDKVCSTTNTDLPSLYHYLEFYGFLYTLKGLPVEYYCGYRKPVGEASRWGRIATHLWRHAEARGTVVLVHGLFDHVGLYQPMIRKILAEGYSVLAVDLPGHGLSDGEQTVVGTFNDYAVVVDECIQALRPHLTAPLVGLGQSTGTAVLMQQSFNYAKAGQESPYQRLVFFAPLVRSRGWLMSLVAYHCLSPFLSEIKRKFSDNTHNESFNQFLMHSDILQANKLSVRWVGALVKWVKGFTGQPKVSTPTLIVQGTGDTVVDWEKNVGLVQDCFSASTLVQIDDAMHHLANEASPYRELVDESLFSFLKAV